MPNPRYLVSLLFCLSLLPGCSAFLPQQDDVVLKKYDFSLFNNWQITPLQFSAFLKSCETFTKMPTETNLGIAGRAGDWINICDKAKGEVNPKEFFEKHFSPFVVTNNNVSEGTFTGYYEPLINGSRTKKGNFIYPIYGLPSDIPANSSYYTREQIDRGALKGRNLELLYTDDLVQLFFLHIQGSGIIMLDNGEYMRVGFAGKNGQEYTSIGKYLIENGQMQLENSSADKIKEWLYQNPEQANAVMWQNKSYIFFRELKNSDPIGALGVELTPEVSLAVDKNFIPLGMPLWVETELPATPLSLPQSFNRLMVSQDTGSAIKGPVRGDIFFGRGQRAETLAGNLNSKGKLYIFLPRIENDKKEKK